MPKVYYGTPEQIAKKLQWKFEDEPNSPPPFRQGRLFLSPGLTSRLAQMARESSQAAPDVLSFKESHLRGEWGDIPATRRAENEAAIQSGTGLVVSRFRVLGLSLYVLTDLANGYTFVYSEFDRAFPPAGNLTTLFLE